MGVEVADVGCGFGGLLLGLAPLLPSSLCLGLEIRPNVAEYVRLRILALRKAHPGAYDNISVLKSNSMKHALNFLHEGQLTKLFTCFPDPHFKKANHRRRIVSTPLLTEYAFLLRPGGRLYTITGEGAAAPAPPRARQARAAACRAEPWPPPESLPLGFPLRPPQTCWTCTTGWRRTGTRTPRSCA